MASRMLLTAAANTNSSNVTAMIKSTLCKPIAGPRSTQRHCASISNLPRSLPPPRQRHLLPQRQRGVERMALLANSLRCNKSSGIETSPDDLPARSAPPLLTRLRHWLCTAAMVLLPGLSPIKVLV